MGEIGPVAKLADALGLGPSEGNLVEVQIFSGPRNNARVAEMGDAANLRFAGKPCRFESGLEQFLSEGKGR